eukprot:scaffold2724_cov260-Pinguiococcus_pyrenoidosus.AAC.10
MCIPIILKWLLWALLGGRQTEAECDRERERETERDEMKCGRQREASARQREPDQQPLFSAHLPLTSSHSVSTMRWRVVWYLSMLLAPCVAFLPALQTRSKMLKMSQFDEPLPRPQRKLEDSPRYRSSLPCCESPCQFKADGAIRTAGLSVHQDADAVDARIERPRRRRSISNDFAKRRGGERRPGRGDGRAETLRKGKIASRRMVAPLNGPHATRRARPGGRYGPTEQQMKGCVVEP